MLATLRWANLLLSFLLELSLLAALGYWGYMSQLGTPFQYVLGTFVPLVVAVLWGLLLAPKAGFPVGKRMHLLLATVLFALGALALVAAGQPLVALVFAALYVVNRVLAFVWNQ